VALADFTTFPSWIFFATIITLYVPDFVGVPDITPFDCNLRPGGKFEAEKFLARKLVSTA
jgi:hypothetical protein